VRVHNYGTSGSILTFFHTTCREPGVITWVQFLEGLPPKIWEGEKTSKIRRDVWQLSTLIATISIETDRQIENRKSSWSTIAYTILTASAYLHQVWERSRLRQTMTLTLTLTTPPTLDQKTMVNFGPQTKSYWRAYWPTQVDIFRETIFRVLGSAVPSNFYTL